MAPGPSDPKRWQLLDSLFQQAADLPPSERDAFLTEVCNGDATLRSQVEKLVADYELSQSFLETPALILHDKQEGQMMGPYRIVREIGQGGMGTVFEAVRDDGEFRQRVAIKLIRKGFDTGEIIERFRRERQILAMVNHPNIARLLDGGASADGRPFVVMEFIDGETLMTYCQEHRIGLSERLRLFRDICAAVAHAHQNLIVHRDLKPANIMVTPQAQVKLLDFGIAKMLASDFADPAQTQANAGALLTPDYASPEQVRGESVTTATDVYALGLILYEMLTGRKAQRATSSARADIERAVCETLPSKPSDLALEGMTHSSTKLRGDLDNIILKALQKEPARRYQSVTQFSEDIERHLNGHPVIARPDSVVYRASKFISRNRWGVGVAAALVAAIGGGVYSTTRQANIARDHFNSVRGLSKSLLTEIDQAALALPGSTKTRQLIVQRSLEYLDKLMATSNNDPDLMVELADAYHSVATIQGNRNRSNIGDYKGAMVSFRKSLDLRRRVEQIKPNALNREKIPLTATEAARVFPGTPESIALMQESTRLAEELAAKDPVKFGLGLANAHFTQGYMKILREDPEGAIPEFEKARELFVQLKRGRNNLATCNRYIAHAYVMQGKLAEAEKTVRQALAYDEEHVAKAKTPRARMDLTYNYIRLALIQAEQGRLAEAEASVSMAGKMRREMAEADPADQRAKLSLVEVDHLLGYILTLQGRLDKGRELLDRALAFNLAAVVKDPDSVEDRFAVADVQMDLGRNLSLSRRCEEASKLLAAARETSLAHARNYTLRRLEKISACR